MLDGSDAVSDWPMLNALLNCASGATWVSLHHGGGVGMGYSQHAGMVIVCDGTDAAARRIERVLWNDPASGVMRHADAGYDIALDCAREHGLDLPAILDRAELFDAVVRLAAGLFNAEPAEVRGAHEREMKYGLRPQQRGWECLMPATAARSAIAFLLGALCASLHC